MADSDYTIRLKAMLLGRRIVKPDGRPLYKYRFTASEYERAKAFIIRDGKRALKEPAGCALFVLALAEWFRRDRDGGGWKWEPPLASMKLTYADADGGVRNLRYTEIRNALLSGLDWWRRPPPDEHTGLKNVWAIVRECGFPLAAIRRESWLRSWILRSVNQMFRGQSVRVAVGVERDRLHVEHLPDVLFDVTCELCEQIFELKRLVAAGGAEAQADPILFLTRLRPDWLDTLCVPAEAEDLRGLVEDVLRAPRSDDEVFSAQRLLVRRGGEWRPQIKLVLDGDLDIRHAPASLQKILEGASRAQIFLRSSTGRASSRAIGLIERTIDQEGDTLSVRNLGRDTFDLELDETVTLVCQVSEREPALISPRDGGVQDNDVLAFAPDEADGRDQSRLALASNASLAWPGETVFLLGRRTVLDALKLGDGAVISEGEPVGDDRLLASLSGEASLECKGVLLTWRTGADEAAGGPLILDGATTSVTRPMAFLGLPRILVRERAALVTCAPDALLWRPRGRGAWRQVTNSRPLGDIEIGVVRDGALVGTVRDIVLPEAACFTFKASDGERRLEASGLSGAEVTARCGHNDLRVVSHENTVQIDLTNVDPGASFGVRMKWADAGATVKFRDASLDVALLEDERRAPRRTKAGAGALYRYTAWTRRTAFLMFDLVGASREAGFMRTVTGETPLSVYRDDIRALLSQDPQHNASARLSWHGGDGWFLEVSRYAFDLNSVDWRGSPDVVRLHLLASGVERLAFVPLLDPARSAEIAVQELGDDFSFQALAERLSAEGPWVVAGRMEDRSAARPIFLAASHPPGVDHLLVEALLQPMESRRASLLKAARASSKSRRVFADHALETLRAARRHQISPVAFDVLSTLPQATDLAVSAMARARDDDLDALLELEADLPLLWSATRTKDWEDAFASQQETARLKLLKAGMDSSASAANPILRRLERLSGRLDLRVHACLAARAVTTKAQFDTESASAAQHPFLAALKAIDGQPLRKLAQDMVIRRADGVAPPRLQLPADRSIGDLNGLFDAKFEPFLRAPALAADMAAGLRPASASLVGALRQARLFDPTFFDAACAAFLFEALRKTPA